MEEVNSQLVEFGYELVSVIPYAYFLSKSGDLIKTTSGKDTTCLYYFSPDHVEVGAKRSWNNMRLLDVPNKNIHVPTLDTKKWIPPPYKIIYESSWKTLTFDLVVSNKYCTEWGREPVNYLDLPTLDRIFSSGKRILYNRLIDPALEDHAEIREFKDHELASSYDNVTTIQKVMKDTGYRYNECQLRAYANCDRFISVQGGNSIMCSYFGGRNIIYAVRGSELHVKSYENWYNKLSGAKIIVVNSYNDLLKSVNIT
jgi:hypothetical protein